MYEIVFKRKARKNVAGLPDSVYERVVRAIDGLAGDPRPPGCRKLRGQESWRVRIGDYRVIYAIDDERRVVEVLNVAHRRESYR